MNEPFEVLLFGDETGDFREPLQKLLERQRGVAFTHFIQRTNEVLREEVRRQPRHVKEQIPPFTDVFELLRQYQDSASRNQILETTFACICQLGKIIRCVLQQSDSTTWNIDSISFCDDNPSQYIKPSDAVLVGLCTGLLAAAAVSASQSILDLVANAPQIVRVAFRIGVKVNGAVQRLSSSNDVEVHQSWSKLVVGVQKEASIAEVTQFNEKKVGNPIDSTKSGL